MFTTEPSDMNRGQATINRIVDAMVSRHHLVECIHKLGHRPNYIPANTYGGWNNSYSQIHGCTWFEYNLASALIGGYTSKRAIQQLIIEVRRDAMEQR